jgi:pimeloyl-ACP methyl ester carboxylesterase
MCEDAVMAPRVVFFPGATGAGDFWLPVADRIPDNWQTRLLSWPGAGFEPHDPSVAGYDDLVVRAAAAVPESSDVVAQSMGGVVAVGLALTHPRKIRRLVLVATSGGLDTNPFGAEDWREDYASEFPDAAPWVTEQHVDHSRELGKISVPTCLIWGDADPISPVAVGRAVDAALQHSTLHVIAGGTHTMARERPDEIAALIVEHLS